MLDLEYVLKGITEESSGKKVTISITDITPVHGEQGLLRPKTICDTTELHNVKLNKKYNVVRLERDELSGSCDYWFTVTEHKTNKFPTLTDLVRCLRKRGYTELAETAEHIQTTLNKDKMPSVLMYDIYGEDKETFVKELSDIIKVEVVEKNINFIRIRIRETFTDNIDFSKTYLSFWQKVKSDVSIRPLLFPITEQTNVKIEEFKKKADRPDAWDSDVEKLLNACNGDVDMAAALIKHNGILPEDDVTQ